MKAKTGNYGLGGYALLACLACSTCVSAQTVKSTGTNLTPNSLNATVAQLRSTLRDASVPAEEISGPAARVFDQLVCTVTSESSGQKIRWELRVVQGTTGNAFSLPDGTVYVDNEMAQILGMEPGLWAAVLAHEIVHITQHHWAKRSMFRDSLLTSHANWSFVELGAFPIGSASWTPLDQEQQLTVFSQDLELEADLGSLDLMARAGFHPDFVTALYHLMKVRGGDSRAARFLASHPGWDTRESNVRKKHASAVAKFERLWPEPYNSPGGNPPVLAFVGRPRADVDPRRKSAEITVPLRCENPRGSLEVTLLVRRLHAPDLPPGGQTSKMERTVGCTSDLAIVSFVLSPALPPEEVDAEFYVMDNRGWVLARTPTVRLQY